MTFLSAPLKSEIAEKGFAFVPAERIRRLLDASGGIADWETFADSWDDLGLDTYMADGGRYRKRRFAVFSIDAKDGVVRQAHQPHYQGRDYNHLNGGVDRWFEPVRNDIGASACMRSVLELCHACFGSLSPDARRWHVEVHQFRIEANPNEAGLPTPEGMHRDGVDHVLVLLIKRNNIISGTTTIADLDKVPLGNFTLTVPLDAAIVDDRRVYHGVTAVRPMDPEKPAHRDVLVVTFKKMP